jgi:hypothetical protein
VTIVTKPEQICQLVVASVLVFVVNRQHSFVVGSTFRAPLFHIRTKKPLPVRRLAIYPVAMIFAYIDLRIPPLCLTRLIAKEPATHGSTLCRQCLVCLGAAQITQDLCAGLFSNVLAGFRAVFTPATHYTIGLDVK